MNQIQTYLFIVGESVYGPPWVDDTEKEARHRKGVGRLDGRSFWFGVFQNHRGVGPRKLRK